MQLRVRCSVVRRWTWVNDASAMFDDATMNLGWRCNCGCDVRRCDDGLGLAMQLCRVLTSGACAGRQFEDKFDELVIFYKLARV
jgi:hypothetical protein